VENVSPKKLSEIRNNLLDLATSEDVVTLGECWKILTYKCKDLKVLNNDDGEHLRDLLQRLAPLSANRLRLDLVNNVLKQPTLDSKLLADFHRLRLSLIQVQLENTASISHRHRPLRNYQRALSEAIASGAVLEPKALLSYTHYIKHPDLLDEIDRNADTKKSSPMRSSDNMIIQNLDLLEDERSLSASELQSLDIEKLHHLLNVENAALLDIFIGSTGKSSRLTAIFCNEAKTFLLPITRQSLNKMLLPIRKAAEGIAKRQITSDGEAFDMLKSHPLWKQQLQAVFTILQNLGSSLFPSEMLNFVKNASLLYLSSHHRLHTIPLHVLPIGNVPPLIYHQPVLYIPKASYLLNTVPIDDKLDEPYLCVNVEDAQISGESFLSIFAEGQFVNRWKDAHSIRDRLEELSRHKSAWFFLHGYPSKINYSLYRLALSQGQRLTVKDVRDFHGHFSGTEIYLFACGSGRPTITSTSEFIGFPSGFLGKGASCVLSSLWSPDATHAISFAKFLKEAKLRGVGRGEAFQTATKTVMQDQRSDLRHWLQYACFVLHGRERENIF
jgi:hypothetical protein